MTVCFVEGPLSRERINCLVVCYTANMVSVGVADGGGKQMERRSDINSSLVGEQRDCLVEAFG